MVGGRRRNDGRAWAKTPFGFRAAIIAQTPETYRGVNACVVSAVGISWSGAALRTRRASDPFASGVCAALRLPIKARWRVGMALDLKCLCG
jgi:hypothetical protein